jgi:hypothetical protein
LIISLTPHQNAHLMAKQAGPIFFEGRLGDLSFYKDNEGNYLVRQAGGPSRDKVKHHRSYTNFRKTGSEFGAVSSTCKLIRYAFRQYTRHCKEGTLCNRLNSRGMQVMRSEKIHNWGERRMQYANVALLEDMEWNAKLSLDQALKADYCGFIDPATGAMHALVPSFVPRHNIKAPKGATHFRIYGAGTALDVVEYEYKSDCKETDIFRINAKETGSILLNLHVPAEAQDMLILGIGIEFYEEVNGKLLPIAGGAFSIVKACRPEVVEIANEAPETPENNVTAAVAAAPEDKTTINKSQPLPTDSKAEIQSDNTPLLNQPKLE